MRFVLSVLVVVAMLVPSPEAEACSCGRLSVEAWPKDKAKAPSNTHVFVRFPEGNNEKVILRLAGTKDTDGIPSARSDVVSMDVRFVELAPTVNLAKGASFEVVIGSGKTEQVVSTFVVGAGADNKAPKAPDIIGATYVHENAVCCNCSSGLPFVTIELAAVDEDKNQSAQDDEDDAEGLYGIWSAGTDKKIDWNRKPDAYVLAWYRRLSLGNSSTCAANNFPIPETGTMVLGFRTISHSGKQSEGRVVRLKSKKKTRPELIVPEWKRKAQR